MKSNIDKVTQAATHSREQTNLCFPNNPPFTISDSPPANDFKEVSPPFKEGGVFISQLQDPLINCSLLSAANFTLRQYSNAINVLVTPAPLFQKDCSRGSLSPSQT
jgi:hypothetical protein